MVASYEATPPELEVRFGIAGRALASFELALVQTISRINALPVASLTFEALTPKGSIGARDNSDLALCRPGTEAVIRVGGRPLFSGIVCSQSMSFDQNGLQLKLELQHSLCRLAVHPRSRVFEDRIDGVVVEAVLAEYGLRARNAARLAIGNRQLIQSGLTDWAMIVARTLANAMWLAATDEGVDILQPLLSAVPDHIVSGDDLATSRSPFVSASWAFHAQTEQVEASAWDIATQLMSKAKRGAEPCIGRGALNPSRIDAVSKISKTELRTAVPMRGREQAGWADARILAVRAAGVRTELCLAGTLDYRLGQTLRLDGFGSNLDGDGLVSGIRQALGRGTWRTFVRTGHAATDVDAALVPGKATMTIGIVRAMQRDPDGWYRIQVRLPTFEKSPSIWARLLLPYASFNSGFFFYPEVGDEAAVEFMDDDPRMAVVTGFFSNPQRRPAIAPHDADGEKGIFVQRPGGQQRIAFSSLNGRTELGNGTSRIVVTDDIDIHAKLGVDIGGASVDITAQTAEIEGKSRVLIKGKRIDMK